LLRAVKGVKEVLEDRILITVGLDATSHEHSVESMNNGANTNDKRRTLSTALAFLALQFWTLACDKVLQVN
jgi:hypothetical protein